MQGRDEIAYYLVQDPLKDGEAIAYNPYVLEKALTEFAEGTNMKRILNVPEKKDGQETMLLSFEESLTHRYMRASQRLRGWKHFLRIGIGGAITYLTLPTLFSIGMSIPFRIFGPWMGAVPTEIQAGSFLLGAAVALIPYTFIRNRTHPYSVRGSKLKRYSRLIGHLREAELQVVENKDLKKFWEHSGSIVEKARGHADKLHKENIAEISKASRGLERCLEALFRDAKVYKVDGLEVYYHRLHASLYHLRVTPSRFWRNERDDIQRILESSSKPFPVSVV